MRTWNANVMTIGQMVAGAHALDKVEATQLLKEFSSTRGRSPREPRGRPDAMDLKSRFEGFAADAQLTIQAIRANDKVSDRYARLRADCGACHDLYAD